MEGHLNPTDLSEPDDGPLPEGPHAISFTRQPWLLRVLASQKRL